eukprot:7323822-Prorocentrum_lima.AAC.1
MVATTYLMTSHWIRNLHMMNSTLAMFRNVSLKTFRDYTPSSLFTITVVGRGVSGCLALHPSD